jgi:hypothetical protein
MEACRIFTAVNVSVVLTSKVTSALQHKPALHQLVLGWQPLGIVVGP